MADPEPGSKQAKPSQNDEALQSNRDAVAQGDLAASEAQLAVSVELKDALSEKLGEIVPEEPKKQEIVRIVLGVVASREIVSSFLSPLPPPSSLQRYNEISPGAAERLMTMAEKEQTHRHLWEQRALSIDGWYSMAGMLAGWSTAMALAVGAVVAAAYGQPAVGIALAAASATGMVWKLVQGRSEKVERQPEASEASSEPPSPPRTSLR